MADTPELGNISTKISLDASNATTALNGLAKQLTGILNRLLEIQKTNIAIGDEAGAKQLENTLVKVVYELNKINKLSKETGLSLADVIPTITETYKLFGKTELEINKINADLKNVVKGMDEFKSETQKAKETLAESTQKAKELADATKKSELAEKQRLATLLQTNKAQLEASINTAKENILKEAGAKADSSTLGRLQLKNKLIAKEIELRKAATEAGDQSAQISALGVKLQENNTAIAAQNAKSDTLHAAKRALGYTALFGAIGLTTAAIGSLTKNVLESDLNMRTMAAVLDLNVVQATRLSNQIRELGDTYGGSLGDIDKVALALGRANIKQKDMVAATKVVLGMARLTGDTFEQSASAVISFQQVFGKTTSIEALGNKLAYIANVSRLSTQDIGTFANYALAAAEASGLTEDAIGGLAAAFSNAGVNASTIGTQIRTFAGILTESTTDVQDFFMGIGVNQKQLAMEIQQGGKVSNDAVMRFVETLQKMDSTKFNNLTGSMDKLTANVLNLMRNNKGNIDKFITELQAGGKDALSNVSIILDAYTVSWEKTWNKILNTTDKGVKSIYSALTDNSIQVKINNLLEELGDTNSEDTKKSNEINEQIKQLKIVQDIRKTSVELEKVAVELETAVGEKRTALITQQVALEKHLADEQGKLEAQDKAKSAEKAAIKKAQLDTDIAFFQQQLELHKGNQAEMDKDIAKLTELGAIKDDLNKNKVLALNVEGLDIDSLITSIKGDLAEGIELSTNKWETYKNTVEELKAKQDKAAVDAIAQNSQLTSAEKETMLARASNNEELLSLMKEAEAYSNLLKDSTINLTEEERKSTNAFIGMINQLYLVFGKKQEIIDKDREVQRKVAEGQLKNIDLAYEEKKIRTEISTQGQGEVAIKKALLKVTQDQVAEALKVANISPEDAQRVKTKLANAELDVAKAITAESQKQNSEASKKEALQSKILKATLDYEVAKAKLSGKEMSETEIAARVRDVEIEKAKEMLATTNAKVGSQEYSLVLQESETAQLEAQVKYNTTLAAISKEERRNKKEMLDVMRAQAQEQERMLAAQTTGNNLSRFGTDSSAYVKSINNIESKVKLANQAQADYDAAKIDPDLKKQDIEKSLLELKKAQTEVQLAQNAAKQHELDITKEMYAISLSGNDALSTGINSLMASGQKMSDIQKQYNADMADGNKTAKQKALIGEKYQRDQIAGYAGMAGAMASMMKEGSREAAAFQAAQTALTLINAVNAVLTQGTGDPYTAIPRMAAMTVMVKSLLSQVGVAFGMRGKTSTSSDAFSAMKANEGTGSILGDAEAKSESITKAMDILKDFAKPQYQTLQSMNKYLANISNNIGGLTSILFRNESFALGQGFTPTSSTKNKISSGASTVGGLAINAGIGAAFPTYAVGGAYGLYGGAATTGAVSGLVGAGASQAAVGALAGTGVGLTVLAADKLLLNGAISKLTNNVIGGIFGKKSVSTSLQDSGIYFDDILLKDAINALEGASYQTIQTTTKKKSWFGSSSSSSTKTYFEDLDAETNRQFSLVLGNIYDVVYESGDALDMSASELQNSLDKFVVSIGKVSLKDKSGQEIQEILSNVFSKVGDDLTKSVYPLLTPFQKVGEGMFETLSRVATGMEEAEFYIGRLGKSFQDLAYTDILNKQGDVGFEALLQSISKVEKATYPVNNNLLELVSNLDATAEELYGVYTLLDNLRYRLIFLGQSAQGISSSMIYGAGSIDALSTGFASFFENFLTESEQLTYNTNVLIQNFNKLGVALPTSKDGFKALLAGLDLTTEAGQELYGRLIILSEAFATVADEYEKSLATAKEALDTLMKDGFNTFADSMSDVFNSIVDMAQSTKNVIDKLTNSGNTSDFDKMVKLSGLVTQFETLKQQGSVSEMSSVWTDILNLTSSIGENSKYADSMVTFLNENLKYLEKQEDVIRVNIVEGLGGLLGLNQEQLSQLKISASDGKITNLELDNISSLTTGQWALLSSGIKVTDAQIQGLVGVSQQQKDQLIEANKDGKLTTQELKQITGLTQVQKDGIVEFSKNSTYFSTEATLYSLNEYMKRQLEVLQQTQANETAGLSKQTFAYGDYIGRQEQIDIAQRLGVSYEAAKPVVQQLQNLSISKNPLQDIKNIVGFNGEDFTNWNAWNQLVAFDPEHSLNIQQLGDQIYSEGQANKQARLERERRIAAFEQAKADFTKTYNTAMTTYEKERAESKDAWDKVYYHINKSYRSGLAADNPADPNPAIHPSINLNDNYYKSRYDEYKKEHAEAYSAYQTLVSLNKEKALKGYATGGYTGDGGKYEPAGIVHRGEYVVNSQTTKDLGLNQGQGGVFKEMLSEMKEMKEENRNMRQLLTKLTADNNKMLNIDRASYSYLIAQS